MKRITISLPDELAAALGQEATLLGVSVSRLARESIEDHLRRTDRAKRKLPFVGLGRSGDRATARDAEKILEAEWTIDRLR